MLGAYSEGEMQVTPSIVDKAAGEILGPRKTSNLDWRRIAIAAIGCLTLVTGYLLFDLLSDNDSQPPTAAVLEDRFAEDSRIEPDRCHGRRRQHQPCRAFYLRLLMVKR